MCITLQTVSYFGITLKIDRLKYIFFKDNVTIFNL